MHKQEWQLLARQDLDTYPAEDLHIMMKYTQTNTIDQLINYIYDDDGANTETAYMKRGISGEAYDAPAKKKTNLDHELLRIADYENVFLFLKKYIEKNGFDIPNEIYSLLLFKLLKNKVTDSDLRKQYRTDSFEYLYDNFGISNDVALGVKELSEGDTGINELIDAIIYENNIKLLISSSDNGHFDEIRYLFEQAGLTADDARTDDNAALRVAIARGHIDIVRYLFEHVGLTADDARAWDNAALRIASYYGYIEIVRYLFEEKNPNKDWVLTVDDARVDDNRALRTASARGHIDVAVYLANAGEYTDDELRDILGQSAERIIKIRNKNKISKAQALSASAALVESGHLPPEVMTRYVFPKAKAETVSEKIDMSHPDFTAWEREYYVTSDSDDENDDDSEFQSSNDD